MTSPCNLKAAAIACFLATVVETTANAPAHHLQEGGWLDKNIVAEPDHGWVKLPDPFFKPHDPQPYAPQRNFHDVSVANSSSVVVLIAALQETKVVETLRTMFARARNPSRVVAGIIQQNTGRDQDALEAYCDLLGTPLELRPEFVGRNNLHQRQADDGPWGHGRYTALSLAACKPASNIRVYRMDRSEAKGPAFARARQPLLLQKDAAMEDFCMQIDAHTVFTKHWDEHTIGQWADTNNDYAILTTYPTNARDLTPDGTPINSNNHWEMPHLCSAELSGNGMVRNSIAGAAANLESPILTKFWAAGLSFGRCHAERDVPADPQLTHIFTGEEFGRGARLWTSGYDFYTVAKPIIGTWYGNEKGNSESWPSIPKEVEAGEQRLAALLHHEESPAIRAQMRGYYLGTRRPVEDYFAFTGLDTRRGKHVQTDCAVTEWHPWTADADAPYEIPKGSPVREGTGINFDGTIGSASELRKDVTTKSFLSRGAGRRGNDNL